MKTVSMTVISLMLCALVILINNRWLADNCGVMLAVNSEYTRLMIWHDNGDYDSWGWRYSHGHTWRADGTEYNLWHAPKWSRSKLRLKNFLIQSKKEKPDDMETKNRPGT